MPARKSSTQVTLVLLGAATLAACGQQDDTLRHDVYASKEDCLKDWGQEPKCEQAPASSVQSGYHGPYWFGPWYRPGQFGSPVTRGNPYALGAPRPGSHAVGSGHASRGGFGASGAAHGASGS